jgi:hypothetical protein
VKLDQLFPVFAICAVILAAVVLSARGKSRQPFDGIFVRDGIRSEFYEGIKGCPVHGTRKPYLLISNREFDEATPGTDLATLFHGVWRAKFIGDLSRLGEYDYWGKRYWREVRVVEVFEITSVKCGAVP